jgi:hypothetical protein
MALPDLTGQNIENTYQRVIQTDGTNFYDGTGSLVNFGGVVFPYTGSAIISGSLIVTGSTDIQYLTASGIPYPTAIGGEGEAIVVDQDGNLIFAYPKAITERVKNVSGGPLPKGTPVHATGSGTQGNIVGVVAADASDPLLMPATFVLNEALADEAEGEALVVGYIQGVNTTGFDSGEVVYVGVGGGFTNIKPTGSNLIQNLGIVLKGNSNNGSGVVYGSGRSNDVPNLPPGYAWIGNENWVATAVPTSSFNEDPFPYTGSAAISGSLEVTGDVTIYGTASVNVLITNYESSSIIYSSGSTKFGDSLDDTHIFTGSVSVTNSLDVVGSISASTAIFNSNLWGSDDLPVLRVTGTAIILTPYDSVVLGSNTNGGGNSARGSNVIVGKNAMSNYSYGNGTSYRNVAIGISAMNSGNGAYNVAIGRNAMQSGNKNNTVGIGNSTFEKGGGTAGVAVGGTAGRFTTGNYNVLLGYSAGYGVSGTSTFSNTISIGYQSGYSLTTGANNIIIGTQAGYNTSGSNNILLGYQAGYNLTGSNQLIIANNSSSALVTGDFANNTFDVSGSISSTDTVTAVTGSFSHLKGNSPITVQDPVTFQSDITGSQIQLGTATFITPTSQKIIIKSADGSINNNAIVSIGNLTNPAARTIAIGYVNSATYYDRVAIGPRNVGGGHQSVVIGDSAASNNTQAGIIAIGQNANRFNTGRDSVAVGKSALYNDGPLGSAYTVAIGTSAGSGQNGTYNTLIGTSAGGSLSGEFNSVLGHRSGYNVTGDYNITLGADSGYNASGSKNVILGYQAGYNLTGSNQLIIANNSSSALVTGDFANNTFDVSGSVSSTDTVTAVTGSFSHLKGNSPITVQDPVTFQHAQGLDVLGNATIHSINEVELQTISKNFNYTSSLNVAEITASVNGAIIDYRLTNLNSGSRVGTFMYAHDGAELSYNDLTIPGGGIGGQPILSASLVNDLVKIDIENAAGFNFTGYAKKFNRLANAIPVADPNLTYVLNEYPSQNVVGAYSIRQLDQFYTGSAMRVRRASDNSELDIEYDVNGYLDTLAIEAHCGGSVGHVTIWYDQSGNNRHLTQSTAANQPKIYDGTSIYEVNGQPCLRTQDAASSPVLGGAIGVDYTGGISVYSIINAAGYGQNSVLLNPLSNGWDFRHGHSGVNPGFRVNNKTAAIPNPRNDIYQILQSGFYDNSTNTIYTFLKQQYGGNFSPIQTGSATGVSLSNTINSELQITTRAEYQELIIMNDYEISNREGIFTNINNYYNIYDTGLLVEYSGSAVAYSVRLLDSTYTGSALRIREDGTNTETDIGFDSNGDLDTASIASHCGSNNGLVVTWYDQSGNGNDATQATTTNQPKIYDGTTGVETENGKPIINLVSGNSCTLLLNTTISSSTTHIFGVAELDKTDNKVMIGTTAGGGKYIAANNNSNPAGVGSSLYINGASSSISTRDQLSDQFQNQTSFNSIQDLSTADQTRIGMLNGGGDSYKMFNMQEIIFYTTDQSSNRNGIEDNINSYFNIY